MFNFDDFRLIIFPWYIGSGKAGSHSLRVGGGNDSINVGGGPRVGLIQTTVWLEFQDLKSMQSVSRGTITFQ